MNRRAEWHLWIRPRGARPSWVTRALVAIAERQTCTMLSPSSGTFITLRRQEGHALVGALRDPLGTDRGDAQNGIRMEIIRAIGVRLTSKVEEAGDPADDKAPVDEMFPAYLVPMLPGRRAARIWRRAASAAALNSRRTRGGTWNKDLTHRIGD